MVTGALGLKDMHAGLAMKRVNLRDLSCGEDLRFVAMKEYSINNLGVDTTLEGDRNKSQRT